MEQDALVEKLKAIFRTEAAELLDDLEGALLELESEDSNSELIDRVFRSLHTLKGSGSTSGYADLSEFLHEVEDIYSLVRDGALPIAAALIDSTLEIKDLVQRYLEGDALALQQGDAPLARLRDHRDSYSGSVSKEQNTSPQKAAASPAGLQRYRIHFAPNPDFYRFGNDPLLFLDDLRAIGECQVTASHEEIPPIDEIDPESAYFSWQIELTTESSKEDIEAIFEFVAEECTIAIDTLETASPAGKQNAWRITFETNSADQFDNAALQTVILELTQLGKLNFESQPLPDSSGVLAGTWTLRLEETAATDTQVEAAFMFTPINPQIEAFEAPAQEAAPKADVAKEQTQSSSNKLVDSMRVSTDKLDRLVNMVGELVILKSQLRNACKQVDNPPPDLESASEGLDRLTLELRDLALDVRTTPIGDTFNRFKRTCRDISRDLNKKVRLEIEGGDTAMDQTIIDSLKDPLVHIVRNCIDHGLESPEQRLKAGKPEEGLLRLSAEQHGDSVQITITDDGRGIDSEKVRAKAVERGIVSENQTLSREETLLLIFRPGFSTADTVSQLSGRGVGLDVVRRQIEGLRGSVELTSEPGQGTSIRLTLPLTLAIIEGLLVQIENDQYVLPLSSIHETIELSKSQRLNHNQRNLVELRGEMLPYIDLRPLFGYNGKRPDRENIVVVDIEGAKIGLVVDSVLGNHQTVLKSLGWVSGKVKVFSGSTVLGNGKIGLICDIQSILELSQNN